MRQALRPGDLRLPALRVPELSHAAASSGRKGSGMSGDAAPIPHLDDLGPEQPDDTLADALPALACRCDRPLPAPDDGELRCTRCGHQTGGWAS